MGRMAVRARGDVPAHRQFRDLPAASHSSAVPRDRVSSLMSKN